MLLTQDTEGWKPNSEKRVQLQCDICGKVTETSFANYNHAQARNGNTGKTKCKHCAVILSAAPRRGKPSHNKGKRLPPESRGKNSVSWKGGRFVDVHGYVMVHIDKMKSETSSGWEHYRKEHVLIIEKDIGRPLDRGEVVHHINGERQDNERSNLWLTDNKGHRDAHQSLQKIGYALVTLGLISFDTNKGLYVAHTKWGELLEQLEEANQQPSREGDLSEGSETRSRVLLKDSNAPTSALHSLTSCDEIVRSVGITA